MTGKIGAPVHFTSSQELIGLDNQEASSLLDAGEMTVGSNRYTINRQSNGSCSVSRPGADTSALFKTASQDLERQIIERNLKFAAAKPAVREALQQWNRLDHDFVQKLNAGRGELMNNGRISSETREQLNEAWDNYQAASSEIKQAFQEQGGEQHIPAFENTLHRQQAELKRLLAQDGNK